MIAIAVPVLDLSNRYFASVAFHGPVQRISIAQAVAMKRRMFETSAQLTHVIIGSGPSHPAP